MSGPEKRGPEIRRVVLALEPVTEAPESASLAASLAAGLSAPLLAVFGVEPNLARLGALPEALVRHVSPVQGGPRPLGDLSRELRAAAAGARAAVEAAAGLRGVTAAFTELAGGLDAVEGLVETDLVVVHRRGRLLGRQAWSCERSLALAWRAPGAALLLDGDWAGGVGAGAEPVLLVGDWPDPAPPPAVAAWLAARGLEPWVRRAGLDALARAETLGSRGLVVVRRRELEAAGEAARRVLVQAGVVVVVV